MDEERRKLAATTTKRPPDVDAYLAESSQSVFDECTDNPFAGCRCEVEIDGGNCVGGVRLTGGSQEAGQQNFEDVCPICPEFGRKELHRVNFGKRVRRLFLMNRRVQATMAATTPGPIGFGTATPAASIIDYDCANPTNLCQPSEKEHAKSVNLAFPVDGSPPDLSKLTPAMHKAFVKKLDQLHCVPRILAKELRAELTLELHPISLAEAVELAEGAAPLPPTISAADAARPTAAAHLAAFCKEAGEDAAPVAGRLKIDCVKSYLTICKDPAKETDKAACGLAENVVHEVELSVGVFGEVGGAENAVMLDASDVKLAGEGHKIALLKPNPEGKVLPGMYCCVFGIRENLERESCLEKFEQEFGGSGGSGGASSDTVLAPDFLSKISQRQEGPKGPTAQKNADNEAKNTEKDAEKLVEKAIIINELSARVVMEHREGMTVGVARRLRDVSFDDSEERRALAYADLDLVEQVESTSTHYYSVEGRGSSAERRLAVPLALLSAEEELFRASSGANVDIEKTEVPVRLLNPSAPITNGRRGNNPKPVPGPEAVLMAINATASGASASLLTDLHDKISRLLPHAQSDLRIVEELLSNSVYDYSEDGEIPSAIPAHHLKDEAAALAQTLKDCSDSLIYLQHGSAEIEKDITKAKLEKKFWNATYLFPRFEMEEAASAVVVGCVASLFALPSPPMPGRHKICRREFEEVDDHGGGRGRHAVAQGALNAPEEDWSTLTKGLVEDANGCVSKTDFEQAETAFEVPLLNGGAYSSPSRDGAGGLLSAEDLGLDTGTCGVAGEAVSSCMIGGVTIDLGVRRLGGAATRGADRTILERRRRGMKLTLEIDWNTMEKGLYMFIVGVSRGAELVLVLRDHESCMLWRLLGREGGGITIKFAMLFAHSVDNFDGTYRCVPTSVGGKTVETNVAIRKFRAATNSVSPTIC